MKYEPKILYNPFDREVEFMCDRQVYKFLPRERRNLEGFVAYHALKETNTGLIEYVPGKDEEVSISSVEYERMPWKQVVSIASKREIFRPGMGKLEVIKALVKSDDEYKGRIIQKSTFEEEGQGVK